MKGILRKDITRNEIITCMDQIADLHETHVALILLFINSFARLIL